MPSDADGVQLAKSHTVDLVELKKSLSVFLAKIQELPDESFALETLQRLVPEFDKKA